MKKLLLLTAISFSFTSTAQIWNSKTPMPSPRQAAASCVLNNIIYIIGGDDGNVLIDSIYTYEPSTDTWTIKAPLNVPRGELGVAVVNNKIYAIGGFDGNSAVNTVEEYDPDSNKWTIKSPMPTARSVFSVAAVNNKIYAVGGWPGNLNVLEEYDPSTDTWTQKSPCTIGRQQINSFVVLNDKLYFTGGRDQLSTIYYKTHEEYDPVTDTWTTYSNLPQPRFTGASTVVNNQIHYLGGIDSTSLNYKDHYIYDFCSDAWTTGLEMLSYRSRHIAASVNDKIYVIGGLDSIGNPVNWNEEYSIPCTITTFDTILISVTDTLIINAQLTNVHPPNNINTIKVFPNPANTHITIDCGDLPSVAGYTVEIKNALNQSVFISPMNIQQLTIDLSSWTGNGIYFIYIVDSLSNVVDVRKIILQ
jgi:N-acetylneuraminic acid mutarotase